MSDETAERIALALDECAEAIRRANHEAMRGPVEVTALYDAIGAIETAVDRLPQTVLYVRRCAERARSSPLRDDAGRVPAERLADLVERLDEGLAGLRVTGRALGRAHAALSHLGRDLRDGPDFGLDDG